MYKRQRVLTPLESKIKSDANDTSLFYNDLKSRQPLKYLTVQATTKNMEPVENDILVQL